MTAPHRLWLAAHHHKAFLNGGWAWVRASGGEVAGAAGGQRRTSQAAMLLAGLADALKGLPAGELVLHAAAEDAARLAPLFGAELPDDADPAAYAPALAALQGRAARLVSVAQPKATPAGFAQAWAEFAADKAKSAGGFRSAIPKPNLAKVPGL
ncbi:ribonuclease H [Phenylobacterium sp.]|jgi:hypothetical protein|uniref:ribonuclease H n=1 Tax=Phenylobacterium sp. TaxID=1871053 RepID=UPI002F91ED21